MDRTAMHADADEAARALVHDHKNPVASEDDGLASKEGDASQAVCEPAQVRRFDSVRAGRPAVVAWGEQSPRARSPPLCDRISHHDSCEVARGMPGRIFVNYRRDDSASQALNVAQYLENVFGKNSIFIDIDRLRAGQKFPAVLEDKLEQSKVMLAIIGPNWLEVRDERGSRRLDDPSDWVRLEIERSLARNIPVIPVLVAGASLPAKRDLPSSLHLLVEHQCARVTTDGFRNDMAGLASDLSELMGSRHWGRMASFVTLTVLGGAYFVANQLGTPALSPWTRGGAQAQQGAAGPVQPGPAAQVVANEGSAQTKLDSQAASQTQAEPALPGVQGRKSPEPTGKPRESDRPPLPADRADRGPQPTLPEIHLSAEAVAGQRAPEHTGALVASPMTDAEIRRTALSKLSGSWESRLEGQPHSRPIPSARITIEVRDHGFVVHGLGWSGEGDFDGTRGFYDWVFADGKRGRTTLQMDSNGTLHGQVRGAGIDWDYMAMRR